MTYHLDSRRAPYAVREWKLERGQLTGDDEACGNKNNPALGINKDDFSPLGSFALYVKFTPFTGTDIPLKPSMRALLLCYSLVFSLAADVTRSAVPTALATGTRVRISEVI